MRLIIGKSYIHFNDTTYLPRAVLVQEADDFIGLCLGHALAELCNHAAELLYRDGALLGWVKHAESYP